MRRNIGAGAKDARFWTSLADPGRKELRSASQMEAHRADPLLLRLKPPGTVRFSEWVESLDLSNPRRLRRESSFPFRILKRTLQEQRSVQLVFLLLVNSEVVLCDAEGRVVEDIHEEYAGGPGLPCVVAERLPERMAAEMRQEYFRIRILQQFRIITISGNSPDRLIKR